MIRTLTYCFLLVLIGGGCVREDLDSRDRIVIEGSISNGEPPRVVLSRKWEFTNEGIFSISEHRIDDARVDVSDGETEYRLTLQADADDAAYAVYSCTELTGAEGGDYTLTVSWGGTEYSAQTHIEPAPQVRSFYFINQSDSLYRLAAEIEPSGREQYYRIHTQVVGTDRRMLQSIPGNFDNTIFNASKILLPINRGFEQSNAIFETQFNKKDVILVRISAQTQASFYFWAAYENDLLNGNNPLAPPHDNLPGNLTSDALGIWGGYGSVTYKVEYGHKEPVPYTE